MLFPFVVIFNFLFHSIPFVCGSLLFYNKKELFCRVWSGILFEFKSHCSYSDPSTFPRVLHEYVATYRSAYLPHSKRIYSTTTCFETGRPLDLTSYQLLPFLFGTQEGTCRKNWTAICAQPGSREMSAARECPTKMYEPWKFQHSL